MPTLDAPRRRGWHSFFLALTQALGVGTNEFSASSTPLPATTQVNWVRGWSLSS
jgi:hypothetical protein